MRMGNNQQDFGADGVFLLKYESNPLLICARTHVLINWDFFLSLSFSFLLLRKHWICSVEFEFAF